MITLTEEMFASGKPVAQGEVLIWMKKFAPKAVLEKTAGLKLSELKLEGDELIVGHSETGHHHVMRPLDSAKRIQDIAQARTGANDNWFELTLHENAQLVHMRSNDTHDGLVFPAGDYIRGLREEQSPEGWRTVAD